MTKSKTTIRSKSAALAIGAALAMPTSAALASPAQAVDYPPVGSPWDEPGWTPQPGHRHGSYWSESDVLACYRVAGYRYSHHRGDVYWTTRAVRAHVGPGQHYPVSRHLPRGTRIVVVGTCYGWSQSAGGDWVRTDLLMARPYPRDLGHRTYPAPPVETHYERAVVPGIVNTIPTSGVTRQPEANTIEVSGASVLGVPAEPAATAPTNPWDAPQPRSAPREP